MSETQPSDTFLDALAQIERISQLSDGLALVILAGPATHSQEALERVAAVLGSEREVFWHPLDTRGSALNESLSSTTRLPALLAYGLEWLPDEERAEVEVGLNLSRDTLVASRALIVFWVERRHLDEFRRLCPDLFHWRSLLLTLSEEDLPLPAAVVGLRSHARRLQEARPVHPDFYFEPLVQVAGEQERVRLSVWAAQVEHGCLEGHPGSGKSVGVAMYAAGQARRASEDGGTVPLLLAARDREVPAADADLTFAWPAVLGSNPEESLAADVLERWANDGTLQIVIDGFDELLADERRGWINWLYRLRRGYPGLRTLLVSRPGVLESEDWRRAEVLPWDRERIDAFLKKGFPLDRRRIELMDRLQPLGEMASSPLVLGILTDLYRQHGVLPPDRTTLLRTYVETLLGRWDTARNLSELRSTTSPQTLRRQLADIALKLLRRGTHLFGLNDLKGWAIPQSDLRYLVERTGLIQEVSPEVYTFSHRIFLEYFAAEGLAELGVREALTVMIEHQGDPLWKDVLILAAPRLLGLVDERDSALRERLTGILAQFGERP